MVLPSLANVGPNIVAKELCEQYLLRGLVCKIFYFDEVVQLQMPCATERISFKYPIAFGQWDIIHSHMFRPDAYVWYHYRKGNIPQSTKLVTTLHQPITYSALCTTYNKIHAYIGPLFWTKLISIFNEVVVLNSDTANCLRQKRGKINITVINNGRTVPIIREISDTGDSERLVQLKQKYTIVGTISSISKRKGLSQMIEALVKLPGYAFVAVGDGPQLRELKVKAMNLGVIDRCLFLGYRANAVEYLSIFDLFVMCTYSEGFPLALIEAAAYGIPTVLSDIPILKAIIGEPNVSYYHLEDIEDLANKLQLVYSNKEKYGNNIRRYYEQNLTANIMADKYIELYAVNK